MTIVIKNNSKLHIIIFTCVSALLFVFIPISFIDRFLAGLICFGVFFDIRNIKFEFNRWYEIVLFIIVSAYLMFAFFGYDLFLKNSMHLTVYYRLFFYALGFIWICYVLQSFLDAIKHLGIIKDRVCIPTKDSYPRKWLILFTIMVPLFALWQIAFNPIVITRDSWYYLDGWLNNIYTSAFPPAYTFLVNIICGAAPTKPEVVWIGITQNIAFSSLLATILMYFHQRWIKFKYIIPVAIILPLIPSFGLHTIVVWADLSAGMSILWLTYVLVRIIDEVIITKSVSKKQQLSFCIQLCISMVLVYFIRSNTFLVYLIMVPVLVLLFSIKKEWKLLITVAISIIIVILIRFPGFNALNVQEDIRAHEHRYHAAMHDMQATYYSGGRFSDDTLTALRGYIRNLDAPGAREMFLPHYVLWYEDYFHYDLSELTTHRFLAMYIDTFIRNPIEMTRSMLNRLHAYWAIDPRFHVDAVNQTDIFDRATNSVTTSVPLIGVYRQPNILTNVFNEHMTTMNLRFPATFIWRLGIWVAIIIISLMTLITERRFIWLLTYIPVFVYLATLYIAMGWTDYRYGLPVFFIGLFLPVTLLLLKSTKADGEIA